MTTQHQDLIFHYDNSLISDTVIDSESSYLSLITHNQGTSPTWLVNSLIENGVVGTACLVNNDLKKKVSGRAEVVFVSFMHSEEFYVKNCKKNGIDLSTLPNFTFIDCFSELFTKLISTPDDALASVNKIFDQVTAVLKKLTASRKIVFIESPEILLLSTDILANQLLQNLLGLNKLCRQLFVILQQDSPQYVDLANTNPLDPVFKVSDFLVKLHHRSHIVLNLHPLQTGRASDITGCLTISNGCIPCEAKVSEKEYIYHVTKESNVKLFFR